MVSKRYAETDGKKRCPRCEEWLDLDKFWKSTKRGVACYCISCANLYHSEYKKKNPDYNRDFTLKRNYGISLDEYEELFKLQDGVCAICHKPDLRRRLCVDHDHKTGVVRGLLCDSCNNGLGRFGDEPLLLEAALAYLKAA